MKRRPSPPPAGPLKLVLVAVVFMLLADHFIFGGKRVYIEEAKLAVPREKVVTSPEKPSPPPAPKITPPPVVPDIMEEPDVVSVPDTPVPAVEKIAPETHPHPRIALIIDDLGMDIKHTRETINLPAPITLAFLPYAPRVRELAAEGKAKGHSLIIHVPMEAMDGRLNIGPNGLREGMSTAELCAAFDVMLASFDGYEGINNHMGSRLTQDKAAMDVLMEVLKEKNLFFVDSMTIGKSIAAEQAGVVGVPHTSRDVFLDHVESRAFVDGALAKAEALAQRRGFAVAIGHPKAVTLEALEAWIPTLEAKGIKLVPVGKMVR